MPCWSALEGDQLYDRGRAADLLERHFGTSTLRGFGLHPKEPAVRAAAAALAYARETQHSELPHVRSLALREARDRMVLDPTTLANLEVFRSLREGGARGPCSPSSTAPSPRPAAAPCATGCAGRCASRRPSPGATARWGSWSTRRRAASGCASC